MSDVNIDTTGTAAAADAAAVNVKLQLMFNYGCSTDAADGDVTDAVNLRLMLLNCCCC